MSHLFGKLQPQQMISMSVRYVSVHKRLK